MEKKPRIAVVDDHGLMRKAISLSMTKGGYAVAMEAADAEEAYRLIPETNPGVLVLDLAMPGEDGITMIRRVRQQWPDIKIVVFTGTTNDQNVSDALLAGADAFVRKESKGKELVEAVEAVTKGKSFLCAEAATALVSAFRNRNSSPVLTERESEVLKRIAEGLTYKEIGTALSISAKTVETYRARLSKKLDCSSRAELVSYALRAKQD
jgi:DNA-binding NarL/FixJ family response regulator